jgi:hypothetical protein
MSSRAQNRSQDAKKRSTHGMGPINPNWIYVQSSDIRGNDEEMAIKIRPQAPDSRQGPRYIRSTTPAKSERHTRAPHVHHGGSSRRSSLVGSIVFLLVSRYFYTWRWLFHLLSPPTGGIPTDPKLAPVWLSMTTTRPNEAGGCPRKQVESCRRCRLCLWAPPGEGRMR